LIFTERSVSNAVRIETSNETMTKEYQSTDESTALRHGRYLTRWGRETPLYQAVTDAVSTVTGATRSTIASQYDQAHAFAVSRLFGEADEVSTSSTGVVKFVLSECIVSVHSDGQLSVRLADESEDNSAI
jgi:hypothetical protein